MVMPHSALQSGQYTKWRTGTWRAERRGSGRGPAPARVLGVDFGYKTAWDLERLEPNTFFPVPSSVVFARRNGEDGKATPLAGGVERWLGKAGASDVRRTQVSITDTSVEGDSPYAGLSRQGAIIVPRCLFFVEETDNPTIVQAGQTITVNPRRGSQDKEPWKSLALTAISEQTVEAVHVFDVHLGETVVPYAMLEPLRATLPFVNANPAGTPGQRAFYPTPLSSAQLTTFHANPLHRTSLLGVTLHPPLVSSCPISSAEFHPMVDSP